MRRKAFILSMGTAPSKLLSNREYLKFRENLESIGLWLSQQTENHVSDSIISDRINNNVICECMDLQNTGQNGFFELSFCPKNNVGLNRQGGATYRVPIQIKQPNLGKQEVRIECLMTNNSYVDGSNKNRAW